MNHHDIWYKQYIYTYIYISYYCTSYCLQYPYVSLWFPLAISRSELENHHFKKAVNHHGYHLFSGAKASMAMLNKSTSPIYRWDTSRNGYLLAEVIDHLHSQFMLPSGKLTVRPWKSLIFSGNQNLPTEPLSARVYVNVLEIMGG